MTPDILNLGCGSKQLPNAVNLDVTPATNPQVVHDLNRVPWPFPDGSFTAVHANNVIEHLDNVVTAMEEIHRVCKPGAVVHITVPHFSCANAFIDPTHRHFFSVSTFHYFSVDHPLNFYTACRFKPRVINLMFQPTLVNKLVWRLANRFPAEYERRWAWIFPAWYVYAELEVVK